MAKYVERFSIQVRFLPGMGEEPTEEWTLSEELEGLDIDEDALDEAVRQVVEQLGGQTTFSSERKVYQGGWGASGITVLDLVVTVATGLAGNALYGLLVAVYKRVANRDPQVQRTKLPLKQAGDARKKPKTRKKRNK